MADQYHHGVRVVEINQGTRPIRSISTAVIGMVCTAEDASDTVFPLNKPVLLTNVRAAIGDAGTEGTLAQSLQAIADQTSPFTIVVRVEAGQDEDATTSNIIGTTENGQYTGMQALLAAKAKLGITPRILGVPGLDSQAVTTGLVAIAQQLRAFVYASAWECADKEAAVAYRDSFGARELMLIWPEFESWNTVTDETDTAPAVARALGLRAKIDQTVGWHKTLSNVPVNGVTGID